MTETIRVTNYAASFGAKKCSETKFEAAEMIRGTNNSQVFQAVAVFKVCNSAAVYAVP